MAKHLCDYFPDAASGNAIFKKISSYKWFEGIIPEHVDTYFYLMAGDKTGMPFLDKYADQDGHITGANLDKLCKMILDLNYNSWVHEYKALTSEYNPIENTDFVEIIKDKDDKNNTGKTISSGKLTVSNENTTTGSIDTSGDANVYGFNSSDPVPAASSSGKTDYGQEDDEPLTVKSETTTDYGTVGQTPVTVDNTGEEHGTHEREYRKHGNIGVTTNAQMITSDIEVWKLNKFYDILISDICKVIALSIY